MAVKSPSKAVAALGALRDLQAEARRKGLARISMAAINAEIATHRREKRTKEKLDRKTG